MNCSMQLPKIAAGNQKPRLFLVGIGGIGMSGLAQLLNYAGYEVAGSDRAITAPENRDWIQTCARSNHGARGPGAI